MGEAVDHCVPPEESVATLPVADVRDAGGRYRGGESGQRVAGPQSAARAAEVE